MFKSEDFELPLEKQLRMRVITQEVDECDNIDALRENLKQCAESLMKYQHLLSVTLAKQIESDINRMTSKIVEEATQMINGNSSSEQGEL